MINVINKNITINKIKMFDIISIFNYYECYIYVFFIKLFTIR